MDPAFEAVLQRDVPLPLHEQVADRIRAVITSGHWPPHYKLVPEPDLAEQFGISRGTLRRALLTLRREGLLVQVQGKGTFVTANTTIEQPIAQEMLSISEALERQGLRFETEVLAIERVTAVPRISALLAVRPGRPLLRLYRRRWVEGAWVALLANYVRLDLCQGLEQADFTRKPLFDLLEHTCHLTIGWARRTFEAQVATGEVAERLEVGEGTPLLYLEQVTYLRDSTPVEYSDVWIRGDRLRLSSVLRRRQ